MNVLGIDVGGSGIKAAPVDTTTGRLVAERRRIATPHPATPEAVVDVIVQLKSAFEWDGPLGCTFPGVVKEGVVMTAANVDKRWIGVDAARLLTEATGCRAALLNDADAAGMAELAFGAGRHHPGVVIMLTIGTGIGSAIFSRGHLLPNTEFGHLYIRGKAAELRASDRARKAGNLGWKKWAARLNEFMRRMEALFWPDLFIVGGGVSKKHESFLPLLDLRTPVVPAGLLNEAGIVGAAMAGAGEEPCDTDPS